MDHHPPEHPLVHYVRNLIQQARSAQPQRGITTLSDLFSLRLAAQTAENITQAAIEEIADSLTGQETLWVFRANDVDALLYLRQQRNWEGIAGLAHTPGIPNLEYKLTYDKLVLHKFMVCSGVMLHPGNIGVYGSVEGFGMNPFGYAATMAEGENNQTADATNHTLIADVSATILAYRC